MLGKGSKKVGKRRAGILNVFTKTINDLDNLKGETAKQIEIQNQRIAKEEQEKKALLEEDAMIGNTLTSMRKAIGMEEPVQA